ncbi:hypothetical protein BDR06DRAFT_963766 [Suillus hirtellus]|nr:hypothetical protein BDR06DRAFT_963766 [Suillus hirtellus]
MTTTCFTKFLRMVGTVLVPDHKYQRKREETMMFEYTWVWLKHIECELVLLWLLYALSDPALVVFSLPWAVHLYRRRRQICMILGSYEH